MVSELLLPERLLPERLLSVPLSLCLLVLTFPHCVRLHFRPSAGVRLHDGWWTSRGMDSSSSCSCKQQRGGTAKKQAQTGSTSASPTLPDILIHNRMKTHHSHHCVVCGGEHPILLAGRVEKPGWWLLTASCW